MAKASVTSIRPPSKTFTEPAKTSWDLNQSADQDAWFATNVLTDGIDSTNDNTKFDALLAQINFGVTGLTSADLHGYDYVFMGVNGGVDETVTDVSNKNGILVTGNGKDTVNGGNGDDLILTGNGKDAVNGGAGSDIIYGENGDDTLSGGADNDLVVGGNGNDVIAGGTDTGPAPWKLVVTHTDPVTVTENVLRDDLSWIADAPADGSTDDGFGTFKDIKVRGVVVGQDYDDNQGSLQKVGVYQDGSGNIHELFSFDPADMPTTDVLNSVTFTVAVYKDGLAQANYVGKVGTFTGMENQQVFFSVNVGKDGAPTAFSDADHVAVFLGDLSDAQLAAIADPQQANLKSQGMDSLSSFYNTVTHEIPGEDVYQWVFDYAGAGDVLTGGADADTFVYAAGDGVDEITDYSRAEGDALKLVGIAQGDVEVISDAEDSFVVFKNGGDYVHDAAIRIVGVNDFSANEIHFA